MKIRTLLSSFVLASIAMMGSASAADEWFTLSEQMISSSEPHVEIKSAGGRWERDVKQVRLSVEGADVQITSLELHWENRKNEKMTDVGILKDGGQSMPLNAPGLKGRLAKVTVHYTILGGAQSATLKVWGYD